MNILSSLGSRDILAAVALAIAGLAGVLYPSHERGWLFYVVVVVSPIVAVGLIFSSVKGQEREKKRRSDAEQTEIAQPRRPSFQTQGHVYRSRSQAFGITMCIIAFNVLMGTWLATGGTGNTGFVVYSTITMVAFTLVGGRAALCSVIVSQTGVRVIAVFNTSELSWSDIERFDIGQSGLFPQVCRIHTRDGKVLRAFGIQEANISLLWPEAKRPAVKIVAQLNKELEEHTAPRPSVPVS